MWGSTSFTNNSHDAPGRSFYYYSYIYICVCVSVFFFLNRQHLHNARKSVWSCFLTPHKKKGGKKKKRNKYRV